MHHFKFTVFKFVEVEGFVCVVSVMMALVFVP